MAMNDSQKKRLENVWEALKHDKIAIFSIAFLTIILILSLLAPVLPLEPNKTDVAHMLEAPSSVHIFGTEFPHVFCRKAKVVIFSSPCLSADGIYPLKLQCHKTKLHPYSAIATQVQL